MVENKSLTEIIDEQMNSAYFVGKNCIGFPEEVKVRIKKVILAKIREVEDTKTRKLFYDFIKWMGNKETGDFTKVQTDWKSMQSDDRFEVINQVYQESWLEFLRDMRIKYDIT